MIYGVPKLPFLVSVSVYDTNPVHYLLVCCNTLKYVQKTLQVYDLEIQMVHDAHFLRLDVNDSYNYKMNLVGFSDQLRNVRRVDRWIRKYKWWWYLFFWGHGLVLVNDYIIYKTLYE